MYEGSIIMKGSIDGIGEFNCEYNLYHLGNLELPVDLVLDCIKKKRRLLISNNVLILIIFIIIIITYQNNYIYICYNITVFLLLLK